MLLFINVILFWNHVLYVHNISFQIFHQFLVFHLKKWVAHNSNAPIKYKLLCQHHKMSIVSIIIWSSILFYAGYISFIFNYLNAVTFITIKQINWNFVNESKPIHWGPLETKAYTTNGMRTVYTFFIKLKCIWWFRKWLLPTHAYGGNWLNSLTTIRCQLAGVICIVLYSPHFKAWTKEAKDWP